MDLSKYKNKRNFKKTPEPAGKKLRVKKTRKLHYLIQKHAASHLHYDLRLELNGVLLSWAVPKGPCLDPNVKRLAHHVEDHPLAYGNFEGIIPKGQYGGGTVMLWDKGEWIPQDANPMQAYKKGHLSFILKADKLKGLWKLIRFKKDEENWLLIKARDEFAKPLAKYDITKKMPLSAATERNMDEIAEQEFVKVKKKVNNNSNKVTIALKKSPQPTKVFPELATLVSEPPEGKEWLHEIKFDGYRFIAIKKSGKTKLHTRHGHDWSAKFPSIVKAVNALPIKNVILDGEIVVLDKQHKSNFQLLQNAIKTQKGEFLYYVFDLLYYENYNVMNLPLIKRKEILADLINKANPKNILYSDHIIGNGKKLFKKSQALHLEGIISKEVNSEYIQKRTQSWVKSKGIKGQEFIICGFTKPKNKRQYFGALLLGTYDENKNLIYHGRVGTGFDESLLKDIYQKLVKHKQETNPFKQKIPAAKEVTWVKPMLVAEIEFTEWTKDNCLRHPTFKGLREDKPARKIKKEIEK